MIAVRRLGVRGVAFCAVLAAVVFGAMIAFGQPGAASKELYKTFASPDGQWRVEIWRDIPADATMPGQASDAPGVARLIDKTGKVRVEAPLEMIQLAEDVDWTDGHARIKLIADWDLSTL